LWIAAAAASKEVIKADISIYNIYRCQNGLPYPTYFGLALTDIRLYQAGPKISI